MGCGLLTIRVCLHSGWTQKRLPSVDNDDFETIPSSGEESSNSSEEEGHHKHVGSIQFASTPRPTLLAPFRGRGRKDLANLLCLN